MQRKRLFLLLVAAGLTLLTQLSGDWYAAASVLVRQGLEMIATQTTPLDNASPRSASPDATALSRAYEQIKRLDRERSRE